MIKKVAMERRENINQRNFSRSKANLRKERLDQVHLLIKSGISEEEAFNSVKRDQDFDNELTYLMIKDIKDRQKKIIKELLK